jgi:hypothetical protein
MGRRFPAVSLTNLYKLPALTFGNVWSGCVSISSHAWVFPTALQTAARDNNKIMCSCQIGNDTGSVAQAQGFFMNCDAFTSTPGTGNWRIGYGTRTVNTEAISQSTGNRLATINTWTSVGVTVNFTAKLVYLYMNGALDAIIAAPNFGNNTYNKGSPTATDSIGYRAGTTAGTTAEQFQGIIAEVSTWNTDIGEQSYRDLARGKRALNVMGSNLGFYMPMTGSLATGAGVDIDLVKGALATIAGTIAPDYSPPIRACVSGHQIMRMGCIHTPTRIR